MEHISNMGKIYKCIPLHISRNVMGVNCAWCGRLMGSRYDPKLKRTVLECGNCGSQLVYPPGNSKYYKDWSSIGFVKGNLTASSPEVSKRLYGI